MKSGDIRIPVTVRGSNTPDIRAIRFPWKAIKNNDSAINRKLQKQIMAMYFFKFILHQLM